MIRVFEARHNSLADQKTLTVARALLIRKQERALVLAAVNDPLQTLSSKDVLTDNEGLYPSFLAVPSLALGQALVTVASRTAGRSDFVGVDKNVSASALVQGVDGTSFVAVEGAYQIQFQQTCNTASSG